MYAVPNMTYLMAGLLLVGFATLMAGYMWLFMAALDYSTWWGLGCMFIPLVSIVFVFHKPELARRPLLAIFAGVLFLSLGFGLFLL